MLTRETFLDYYHNDKDKLNAAFTDATAAEQDQYIIWLNELNPTEEPTETDLPEQLMSDLDEAVSDDREEAIAQLDKTGLETARLMMQSRNYAKTVMSHAESARKRAVRANMLRRLKKVFRTMQLFTIGEAAYDTSQSAETMGAYLVSEAIIPGSQIGYNAEMKKFYIINPFL